MGTGEALIIGHLRLLYEVASHVRELPFRPLLLVLSQVSPIVQNNDNNNFIYTLESEVKLRSVVFTGSNAIQYNYSNNTSRMIQTSIGLHS